MVIQIHQNVGDLCEGSTHTTYDWNEELEEDKEEENEVIQGAKYRTIEDVKDAVKYYTRFFFGPWKSSKIGGSHYLMLQYLETSLILYFTIQNLILF